MILLTGRSQTATSSRVGGPVPDELDATGERTGGSPATDDPPTALSPQEPAGALPLSSFPSRLSASADMSGLSAVEALAAWPQFEVGELLGEGGMGQVFRAVDTVLKRTVALKVLRRQDPHLLGRFLQEAQTQARVDHPNVCKVYEVGEVAGHPYIAMQYVHGQTLDQAAVGLSLEQRVVLMRQVAEAVHAAHQLGLIHRDIKPSNILVEQVEGQGFVPFVTDFGLARETSAPQLTQTGTITGTPQYMSPEQARGSAALLDRRTDVYSLGATLYELLTGRPPFTGGSAVEVLLQVVESDPPRVRQVAPEVPEDLETIVLKCMDKEVGRRYESARALAEDLQRFLSGDPILARPGLARLPDGEEGTQEQAPHRGDRGLPAWPSSPCCRCGVSPGPAPAERARLARQFRPGVRAGRRDPALRLHDAAARHPARGPAGRGDPPPHRRRGRLERGARRTAPAMPLWVGPWWPSAGPVRPALAWNERGRRGIATRRWRTPWARRWGWSTTRSSNRPSAWATTTSGTHASPRSSATSCEPALGFLRQAEGASLAAPAYAQGLIALYEEDFPRAVETCPGGGAAGAVALRGVPARGGRLRRQAEVAQVQGGARAGAGRPGAPAGRSTSVRRSSRAAPPTCT